MRQLKPITDIETWEKFLLGSDQVNFLHSWQWGEMHRNLNHGVLRFGLYDGNRLCGLIQLIKVKARRATYLECPGGPVIDWNINNTSWLFNQLKPIAGTEGASFIRIRPNILAGQKNLELVKAAGLRRAPMHLTAETTWILDLKLSEAELLAGMRKTTRYLIRKAEKLGVVINQSTDEKDIDRLYRLQRETVERKHFVPFSRDYFMAEFKAFLPENIRLFSAEYRGRLLALAMIIFFGREAVYHYSGSSNEYRQVPASYLLQWEVIKAAKSRGLKQYNFWGFTADPRHRFYGPSLFKQGFGGRKVDFIPAQDLVVSPAYWPNFILETLRRKWRRL